MKLEIRGKVYDVEVTETGHGVHIVTVDGTAYEVRLPDDGDAPPREAPLGTPPPAAVPPGGAPRPGAVVAPLPGMVVSIEVDRGDEIRTGQVLAVLESMKMNIPIKAPAAGRVKAIHVRAGQSLGARQIIMEIDPAEGGTG
jgi:biotin carboxyl carrier protein